MSLVTSSADTKPQRERDTKPRRERVLSCDPGDYVEAWSYKHPGSRDVVVRIEHPSGFYITTITVRVRT